jgi:hypothetical protein
MRNLALCVAALLIVGGMFIAMQSTNAQPSAHGTEGPIWQYKVVHIKDLVGDTRKLDAMVPALAKNLNDAGGDGWELCHEINGAVVFKRKK